MTLKLTGHFIEINVVDDLGEAEEAETKLALTTDDIEIPIDITEAETKVHGTGRTVKKYMGASFEFDFGGLLASTFDALKELGLVDGDRKLIGYINNKDLRLKVFAEKGDTTPAQVVLMEECSVKAESLEWPDEDFATWDGGAHINGEVTFEEVE